jgi:hypothetical protein
MSNYENFQQVNVVPESTNSQPQQSNLARNIGGTLEVRVGQGWNTNSDTPSVPRSGPSVQSGLGGVMTTNSNGSQSHQAAVTTVQAGMPQGGTDFMATAKNNGLLARGNITSDTVVEFGGVQASIGALVAQGLIYQNDAGRYVAAGEGSQSNQQQQGQDQQQSDTGPQYFPSEVEEAVGAAIEPFSQHSYDSTVVLAATAGLDSINWRQLADQNGMTEAEARERGAFVAQAFEQQANSVAKAAGIEDPSEVWSHLEQEMPEEFARAKRQLVSGRSTAGLKALVADYFKSVPPTIEALHRGGIKTGKDSDGSPTCFVQNRWMSVAAAARAGLV